MEKQVKELSGNENAEILSGTRDETTDGEVFYEIDIR